MVLDELEIPIVQAPMAGGPSTPELAHLHFLTAPLRAAARERDDEGGFNLWAGQTHRLARALPAAEIVRALAAEAEQAMAPARSARPGPT